ncbi:Cytosine/adenosine deaminase [Pseudomonas sp. NFIX10]|uniref:amidohydrolase family protein n=1 Tax=unclassified Pseudomonas TaxID=196821 RepID=UPI0008F1370A|nr:MULTISPECIES: amidohydrolase family protein [unclassified Pseudomonas]SFA92442.1 Cytosine/adenosine deaminase [Pseudomonas sp. NFIX10]SFE37838.1 Cytosine/adenosine deaminase [Pseudomonas sp. NFACC06-1]
MAISRLIKNAWIVTNDDVLGDIKNGSLLIEGALITAVGGDIVAPPDCEIIDGTGMIVIPGLIDMHKHLWQGALRSICGDMTLLGYLHMVRQKFLAVYQPEDSRLGSYASALEMISGGVTSVFDHSHCIVTPEHADATVEGVKDAGIRGIWGYGYCPVYESDGFATHASRLRDARRILDQHFGANDGLLRMGIAITEQSMLPFEHTEAEIRSAREMNLKWTGHTACGIGTAPISRGTNMLFGKGLIDSRAILSHCNEFGYNDFMMMQETGAHFVSSPDTELYMGINKPVNFLDAVISGVNISLGTDTVSCMTGDMFAIMRMAMVFARHQINGATAGAMTAIAEQQVSVRDIFRWATINGAKAMGLDHLVGSLVPGKQADVVLINATHLNLMPVTDPVTSLVLAGNASNVDTVFIAGKLRKRGGVLVDVDVSKLVKDLTDSQQILTGLAPDKSEETRPEKLDRDVERWADRLTEISTT